MKAKITKSDGTVIELEGEPLELVLFLPDLKGFELPKFQPLPVLPEPIYIPTPFFECTCNQPWWGIGPPPPCPTHGGIQNPPRYTWTITTNSTNVKVQDPDRELEFNP